MAVKAGKAVGSGLVHVGRGVKNEITEYQTKKIRLAIQRRKDWEALPKHLRRELLEEAREEKARKELARYRRQKHDIELADRRLSYHGGNRDTRQPVRRKQPSEADDLARIFGSGYIGGRRTKYSDRDLIGI